MSPSLRRIVVVCTALISGAAQAQNGLADDRVSLPDGPGSVGGVGENIEVSDNLGTSSYRVPVEVPEGATPEMTPSLAIAYNSGAGVGIAGIGWGMSWPVIERTTAKGLPEYTTDDLFSGDSGELVYVGDVDGAREYRARFEGAFVRYRWHDVGDGAAGYWTAEYPDGRIGTFGATADGTLENNARVSGAGGETFAYHLVELRDPVGRGIVYTYTKDGGWPLVDEVRYGFTGDATPRFSVRASYEPRPDIVSNATPGHVMTLNRRLSGLAVNSNALVIKRYELAYEDDDDAGGMSRLASITTLGRDGGVYPVAQRFSYSRTLAGACDVGCEQPFLVDMGVLPGGVSVGTGRAALIDINGDALPDVVASDDAGNHTFHVSALSGDGQPRFNATPTVSSMGGTARRFLLGAPSVQLFDVNGDGFVDIVDQVNATALCNFGDGDWSSDNCLVSPDELPTLSDDAADPASEDDPLGMRFFDYDNDKRIDLMRTESASSTTVFANTPDGFTSVNITPIGSQFDVDRLEMTDMNGDGLLDPTNLVAAGPDAQLRTRLNLGFGNWTDPISISVTGLSAAEFDDAQLEDIDGDGLSDVVVVAGTSISYWRNLNGDRFSGRVDITNTDVVGGIPVRDGSETVLFADMNGNGTDDVVYISNAGGVRFVELFPVRPNLLSRIENGIGWVQTIAYGTAIAERARDVGTPDEWPHKNPVAAVVVKQTDSFVTLTGGDGGLGLHEITDFIYRDTYYDPNEKQPRGFAVVERLRQADESRDAQEAGREVRTFDVGVDDVYRAGQLIRLQVFGGPDLDAPIRETRVELEDCDLGDDLRGFPLASLSPPVRFVCPGATVEIHQERAPVVEWVTTRVERSYDDLGNLIIERDLGVIHLGPPEQSGACAPCDTSLGPDIDSGACGAQCLGDEQLQEVSYITPGVATGGRWLARLPVVQRVGNDTGADTTETAYFYDGPAFVGLDAGAATRGLLTRTTARVGAGETIPVTRVGFDAHGNISAVLSPNGDPNVPNAHRRDYDHDPLGLRVTRVTIRAGAHDLVQEVAYESAFLLPSEATDLFVVKDGVELTPRNASRYRYDEFARVERILHPGDNDAAPTETFAYELSDPVSRVVSRMRRTPGGPADVERVGCVDGRGHAVQTRTRVNDNTWIVDGFNEVNARNNVVRSYQPYASTSDACEAAPPGDVRFTAIRYDAVDRVVQTTLPDAGLHGSASSERLSYGPLFTEVADEEDSDDASPHAATPVRTTRDGLDRVVRIERLLTPTSIATYRFGYDPRSNLAVVADPNGVAQTQVHDLAGRVLSSTSPNAGTSSFTYDAAGQVVRTADARGVVVINEYDAVERRVATYAEDDREATLETFAYDRLEDCTRCTNAAGREVLRTSPVVQDRLGYDPRGRQVFMERTIDGIPLTSEREYDGVGALTQLRAPDGQLVRYSRDLASRVIAISDDDDDTIVESVTYDDQGQLASLTHGNGVQTRYAWDDLQRVAGIAHGDFYDIAMTRDRVGHIVSVTSNGAGLDRRAAFTVDAWYRPTSAALADETLSINYDVIDNITAMTSSLGESSVAHQGTYAYDDSAPNAVRRAGGIDRSYDAAGQLVQRGEVAFTWDHLGRPVSASLLASSTSSAPSTSRFDFLDLERVARREGGGRIHTGADDFQVRDGIATLYVRLGGQRVARLQSDTLLSTYADVTGDDLVDIADAVAAERDDDQDAASLARRAVARRLLFEAGDHKVALHTDWRGSVIAASSAEGALLAERDFYPYGAERTSTGFVDAFGFAGQEQDELTGLLRFGARSLDVEAGRWTSPDPLYDTQGLDAVGNLGESTTGYAYVANGPIDDLDPTGLGLRSGLARVGHKVLRGKALMGPKEKFGLSSRGSGRSRRNFDKLSTYIQNQEHRHSAKMVQRKLARLDQLNRIVNKVYGRDASDSVQLTNRERRALKVAQRELARSSARIDRRIEAAGPTPRRQAYGLPDSPGSQAQVQELRQQLNNIAGATEVLQAALELDNVRRAQAAARQQGDYRYLSQGGGIGTYR